MSYERMLETEQRLQQEVDEPVAAAQRADEEDDAQFGDRRG